MAWTLPERFEESIYAGWLGKVIGVLYGAPIEGWSYDRIQRTFGEINDYVRYYKRFAADDDTSGPMMFIRALEDYRCDPNLTAEEIGRTWLDYIADGHGTLWWGGYGVSTEHTAYLNMKHGIPAPRSGSVEQNGAAVAEQIGGQIFIDPWGLVTPGNPELAANLAAKAASVSHGGDGVHGGVFIATMISGAFVEKDIQKLIHLGLQYIPEDSHYTSMVRDIVRFYGTAPDDWHACYRYIFEHYGYDKYPGNCHIIPNSAVIVMSLLYGRGDFSRSISICNSAGWDTDCNVANVGCILGVIVGLDGIDEKWRAPINDELVLSSNIGTRNLMDLPECVGVFITLATRLAEAPMDDRQRLLTRRNYAHFAFPGSSHGLQVSQAAGETGVISCEQSGDVSLNGLGSLKLACAYMSDRNLVGKVFKRTYYRHTEFDDNRYEPSLSPRLYPGQTISAALRLGEGEQGDIRASIYAYDDNHSVHHYSDAVKLSSDGWSEITLKLPGGLAALFTEVGVLIENERREMYQGTVYLGQLSWEGPPDYRIDFANEQAEFGSVSQWTYNRGIWTLGEEQLIGSCAEVGEAYTGDVTWQDYRYAITMTPLIGSSHRVNFRVKGAQRSYSVGLEAENKLVLWKRNGPMIQCAETPFNWNLGQKYRIDVEAKGDDLAVSINGDQLIRYTDADAPFLSGQVGVSVKAGRTAFRDLEVSPVS